MHGTHKGPFTLGRCIVFGCITRIRTYNVFILTQYLLVTAYILDVCYKTLPVKGRDVSTNMLNEC